MRTILRKERDEVDTRRKVAPSGGEQDSFDEDDDGSCVALFAFQGQLYHINT